MANKAILQNLTEHFYIEIINKNLFSSTEFEKADVTDMVDSDQFPNVNMVEIELCWIDAVHNVSSMLIKRAITTTDSNLLASVIETILEALKYLICGDE